MAKLKFTYKNKELSEKEFEEKSGYNPKEVLWYGRSILGYNVVTERPKVTLPEITGTFSEWLLSMVAEGNSIKVSNDFYCEEAGNLRAKAYRYSYVTDKVGTIRHYIETAHSDLLKSLTAEQATCVLTEQTALFLKKASLLLVEKYPSRGG